MPRVPTVQIPPDLLESLFVDYDLWTKISDGKLSYEPIAERDAPSHSWPNATSRIVKHSLPEGKHIATTHRIVDHEGNTLHWDAKDFVMDDVRLWRY